MILMRALLVILTVLPLGFDLIAQPNLVPFQPNDWSAAIVVSTSPGDFTDDQPLRADQDLFIDWAIANLSTSAVNTQFVNEIFVDGVLKYSWVRNNLGADLWNSSHDNNIGKLDAGPHIIRMVVDAGNLISESNENDNQFVKRISVQAPTGGGGQTHAVDFRNFEFVPSEITVQVGDTIVFTNQGGSHTVTGIGADPFCGSDAIPVACQVTFSEVGVFSYRCLFHSSAGPPPSGMVGTVTVMANNTGGTKPNLVPFQPNDWSAAIVVSTNPGDFTDDQPLLDNQDLFVDWAVANLSEVAVNPSFVTRIYVDGDLKYSWIRDGLGPDAWNSSDDNNIGKLAAGPHVIRMEVDADNAVDESDESDNVFEKQFDVQAANTGGQTHQVDFRNFEFDPSELTIQVGAADPIPSLEPETTPSAERERSPTRAR